MAVRSCHVTIKDTEGVTHAVEVTAETVYEAVAFGLAATRGNEWVTGIAQGLNSVQVCASDVPVVHSVQTKDFTAWLERSARSPKDLSKCKRIKEILGMANGRWWIRCPVEIEGAPSAPASRVRDSEVLLSNCE